MLFEDIPLRLNGQRILREWFNTIRSAGITSQERTGFWTRLDFTYEDFDTGALTESIEAFELAAQERFEEVVVKHSTPFSGPGITDVKVDLGITGELERYIADFDVDQAVSESAVVDQVLKEIRSFTSATSIKLTATAVGGNLNELTAGALTVWVKRSKLP